MSILIEAVKLGNPVLVKKLIDDGANVHAWNDYALRHASYYGRTEIVNVLKTHYAKNGLKIPKGLK